MNFNETIYRFRPGIWINDLVLSSFLALVSLYLAIALLYHQIKVEKRLKDGLFRLPIEKRYGVLSKYTCIAIAIASIIRHINSIGLLLVEGSAVYSNASMLQVTAAGVVCDVLPPIGNVALTVGSGLVYLFLWFRQRVFLRPFIIESTKQQMCNSFQLCSFVFLDSVLDIFVICLLHKGSLPI